MKQWITKRLYRIGQLLLDKQIQELNMAGSIHWYLRKSLIKRIFTLATWWEPEAYVMATARSKVWEKLRRK
jgi:hypothetical protein